MDRRAFAADDDLDPVSIPGLDRGPVRASTTAATQTIEKKEEPAMAFQEAHPALLIPGPIELEDDVLRAMGHFRWGRGNRAGAAADRGQ